MMMKTVCLLLGSDAFANDVKEYVEDLMRKRI